MDKKWREGWIITTLGVREQVCRVETRWEEDGCHIRVPTLVEDQKWPQPVYPTQLAALAMLLMALERRANEVRRQIHNMNGGS